MNLWSLLGPIFVQIIQAIIARKSAGVDAANAPAQAPVNHAQMDRWATELENHVKSRFPYGGEGAQAATAQAGLINDVQSLIAALRGHDYQAVITLVQKILFG